MSKGEIVSHLGEGRYRVRQKLAVERINESIAKLNERIAELAVDIPTEKLKLLQAQTAVEDKAREIDLLIDDLQAGVEGVREQITKLQTELIALQADTRISELRVSELIAENLSALKRRGQLEAVPEGREIEAWCADYTLDLNGDVGLVDVNDEGGQGVVIQPGYGGEGAYDAFRDGALFPNLGQSGAQIYFNAAVLPGVQKWMPRYRVGQITRLQVDLCDVALDSATSSAQDLPINQTDILSGVPIVYMDCNGSAFTEGDRVVVRFTSSGPLVIGFESDPVPCSLFGFVFEPAKWEAGPAPTYQAPKKTYGEPFEDMNGQINSPLGTEDGSNSAWTATPDSGDLVVQRGNARSYGNKNWFNTEKLVLSWDGPPGRAHRLDQIDVSFNGFLAAWKAGPNVYHDLEVILDLSEQAEAGAFVNVHGASIYEDVGGKRWLVAVASDESYATGQTFKVFRITVDALLQPFGLLQFMHETTLLTGMAPQSHFYFSEDGTKAVCTIVGDLEDDENLHIDLVRYDINSGFSLEQLWTRVEPVGSRTTVDTYVVDSDPPSPASVIKTGTVDVSQQVVSHDVPIYCDYVGDREVIAYERRSGSVTSIDSDWIDIEGPGFDTTGTRVTSVQRDSAFEIITSDAVTLFSESEPAFINTDLHMRTLRGGAGDSVSVTNSESEKRGGIDWGENLLAIDVRFGFCAVVVGGFTYSLNESIDDTYTAQDANGGYLTASGSIDSEPMREKVEIWRNGERIKEIEALTLPSGITHKSYGVDIASQVGITGSNTNTTIDVLPQMPLEVGSKFLMTAASYTTGPHSISGIAMNYPVAFDQRSLVTFNEVSGYDDPVEEILERTEASGYLLCSVGLI